MALGACYVVWRQDESKWAVGRAHHGRAGGLFDRKQDAMGWTHTHSEGGFIEVKG